MVSEAQKRYNHSIFGKEAHRKCELKRKALIGGIKRHCHICGEELPVDWLYEYCGECMSDAGVET